MKRPSIFIHLPAYREPELVPTIKDALNQAKYPERLVFGICRQFNPEDGFDNVDEFRQDPRFRIVDIPYEQAKGLPYARNIINTLIIEEDYILQLDSHHRFAKDWDEILIKMHRKLKRSGVKKPILTGYLPCYTPGVEGENKTQEPWQQQFVCFYPHGTIFIRPGLLQGWQDMKEPVPSRFLSGHFCFAERVWAKEIKHDPDIYFSGEEINLTVRSYTHGYDFFHPHRLVIWHATMREERNGILVWDDQSKRGEDWWTAQTNARAKIRQLFGYENNGFDLTGFDLGTVRSLREYEKYAGIHFEKRSVQKYTLDNHFPPNPRFRSEEKWEESFLRSFYHLVDITSDKLYGKDYEFILVAYDDENGNSLRSDYITGSKLEAFLRDGRPIHYEDYFLVEKAPSRVVYWGYSKERGWAERFETTL